MMTFLTKREYYFRGPYEGWDCSMSGLPIAECGCVDCTLKRVGWARCRERRWGNLAKVVWEWARGLLMAPVVRSEKGRAGR